MMTNRCQICHNDFVDNDRVVFSHRETFVFKPANVQDEPVTITQNGQLREVSAAAILSPGALAERRKEHLKTAVVNTFGDWGKMQIPQDAYYFRHQWCEPQRTGAGLGAHATSKHSIRFGRAMPGRLHG